MNGAGFGVDRPAELSKSDDEYDAFRKRMMLAYRFRPNPLVTILFSLFCLGLYEFNTHAWVSQKFLDRCYIYRRCQVLITKSLRHLSSFSNSFDKCSAVLCFLNPRNNI